MKQVLLTSAALLLSASVAAFAQTTPRSSVNSPAADMPASASPSTAAMNRNAALNNAAMSSGTMFTTVPAGDELSSKVVGLDVYNNANQNVGKIKDVAFDQTGVKAYIVAVGGFLGMGDHYVAVQPSAVNLSFDANAKKWHAAMNTDESQLKAAPEYKYSSND